MDNDTNAGKSILNNILFSGIEDKVFLKKVNDSFKIKKVKVAELLFQQGDAIDGLYLIFSGQIQVCTAKDGKRYSLSHAEAGHLVGEFLLQGDSVRSVSAEVIQDSTLYFLSVPQFFQLVEQFPEQGSLLGMRIANRLFWNQTILALQMCHLFENLTENIVRQLVKEMDIVSISSNTLLIKQHDVASDFYIIINGLFQVYQSADSDNGMLRVVGRGESIGEIGVISQSPRLANVRAIRDSTVAKLSQTSYEKILKAYPVEISQSLINSAINHFYDSNKRAYKATETFVLVDLSFKKKPNVVKQLTNALGAFGLSTYLTSDKVDAAFSQEGIAQSAFESEFNHALLQWIAEQEIAYQSVIFVTDDSMTQWTKRCLRQADHILFLVNANDQPSITPLEEMALKELKNQRIKKTLILTHADKDSVPEKSAHWLQGREFTRHHHIRVGVSADFSRVARFLTENTIGLVLGGGGARGFAHIGVIRAFKTLKIPIDIIGGNSMGAVIAAQYAMQWTDVEMMEKTRELCLQRDSFTLPILSVFSGKKMTHALRQMFGDRGIEDLWHPFFSVSCNISRATLMTHDNGSLLAAVLNSNTPPGLFPPQVVEGDLLVDGALLNNVPVDVMAKRNEGGAIIAVDVNVREDLLNNTDHQGGMSGWQVLLNKINPFSVSRKSPNLIDILSRASMIGGLAQRKKGMDGAADLYLQPPVNNYSLMSYKQAKEIENIGYQHAMTKLQSWLKSQQKM